MSLSIGIVGLPNVGKSTLFTALTKKGGLAANYPFATIDPNVGIVDVPDERLGKLAEIVNPGRIVPATVEFVDIAGLVKGANEGEGLGNQFLANIRETDAICEVVRYFSDPNVMREVGRVGEFVDPAGDAETFGDLTVDERSRAVSVAGKPVDLTPKEYELLVYFKNNRHVALSRETILNAVWGYDYFGDLRTVDTHIKKLRAKLGPCGALIGTVRGYGYRFDAD